MALTKTQLIGEIYRAFEGVVLEDGVGLWEGFALDERLERTLRYDELKAKDERQDWQKIPVIRLYECNSSLSFFDPKGMRFHLGLYLLFALDVFMDEEDALHQDKDFNLSSPEVKFALTNNLESDFSKKRFSLLNNQQIQCVVYFLEYILEESQQHFRMYEGKQKSKFDKHNKELTEAITLWKIMAIMR